MTPGIPAETDGDILGSPSQPGTLCRAAKSGIARLLNQLDNFFPGYVWQKYATELTTILVRTARQTLKVAP